MMAVQEAAHIQEKGHDQAFYQRCTRMEPRHHQYAFDLRVYQTHMEAAGKLGWPVKA